MGRSNAVTAIMALGIVEAGLLLAPVVDAWAVSPMEREGTGTASPSPAPSSTEGAGPAKASSVQAASPTASPAANATALHPMTDEGVRRRPVTFPPCPSLPPLFPGSHPFTQGEKLSYDLDVTGAVAGTMTLDTLPVRGSRRRNAQQRVTTVLSARTGTLFSKVRSLNARIKSEMNPREMTPLVLKEDFTVDGRRYQNEVTYGAAPDGEAATPGKRDVSVSWRSFSKGRSGTDQWAVDGLALDYLSAFNFFRELQLKPGDAFCVDVMVLRRLWRLEGTVEAREHASTPAGEFETLHLKGKALRHDKPQDVREVHYWVSDDEHRLPVAAMGVIDLGTLRAVLSGFQQGRTVQEPARPSGLTW